MASIRLLFCFLKTKKYLMITIVALNDDIVAIINFYALHYNYKTEEFLKIAVLIFK